MTEVHVVRADNSHLYETELDQYFRGRYQACVLERGWKDLERPDGRDIDQFDTADTIHLLAIDEGKVVGGIRFCPTTAPTLLSEVFPQLSLTPLVGSSDIYELTRIWVAKNKRGKTEQPTVEALLTAGSLECALTLGMTKLWAMIEPWRILRNLSLGWTVTPLGPPHEVDGASVVAVEKDVSERIWIELCPRVSVPGPILIWNGAARPFYRFPELTPAVTRVTATG
jgi:acyl-homoserine lactone synthase